MPFFNLTSVILKLFIKLNSMKESIYFTYTTLQNAFRVTNAIGLLLKNLKLENNQPH